MELKVQRLRDSVKLPTRGTEYSSGLDIYIDKHIMIYPKQDYLYPTGLRFEIPIGYDLVVENKSGVSTKKKLDRGACVVDSDYRGEVHIHLFNNSDRVQEFSIGDKIAQIIMRPVIYPTLVEVKEISTTETIRGEGGFGHTGK
jgi:dUTP pyrophosphatase